MTQGECVCSIQGNLIPDKSICIYESDCHVKGRL